MIEVRRDRAAHGISWIRADGNILSTANFIYPAHLSTNLRTTRFVANDFVLVPLTDNVTI